MLNPIVMNKPIKLVNTVRRRSVLIMQCITRAIAIAGREINKARPVLVRNNFSFVSFDGPLGGGLDSIIMLIIFHAFGVLIKVFCIGIICWRKSIRRGVGISG